MDTEQGLTAKLMCSSPHLDERQRRLLLAVAAAVGAHDGLEFGEAYGSQAGGAAVGGQQEQNCCVVLDVFSRRVVGWAIDSRQQADLATNALGMAIDSRGAVDGAIIHADHGTQFTSWTFTQRARKAGLLPSLGTVGDPYDNAVIESFWARMQVELLNRKRWKTRIELANAIFEYIEGFHNRRRRHSALGWQSRLEFETIHTRQLASPHR